MTITFARVRTLALGSALTILATTAAHAQTRTVVSSFGDDANPCSPSAPCRTFQGALSKTAPGGFINVLDPGGYGTVVITKSITIDGGGMLAGVLTPSGANGITVNGNGAVVHLRNLSIESPLVSAGARGTNGIDVAAAAEVHVERCVIASFANTAINFHPAIGTLYVSDTTIMNNINGGIIVASGRAMIENLHANGNGNAVAVTGVAIASVRNSYAAGGSVGYAAIVAQQGLINIENSVAIGNTTGIVVNSGATARVSNSTIVSNSLAGLSNDGVSFIVSLQGNSVTGNVMDGTFTSTVIKQ